MEYLKETIIWNNSLLKYLISVIVFAVSLIAMNIILILFLKVLLKLNTKLQNEFIVNLAKSIKKRLRPLIFIIALSFARVGLVLPKEVSGYWTKIVVVFFIIFVVMFICDIISNFSNNYLSNKKG